MVNFFRDVSERKQIEHTTSLLAAIVDSSDDAIVSKDSVQRQRLLSRKLMPQPPTGPARPLPEASAPAQQLATGRSACAATLGQPTMAPGLRSHRGTRC